MDPLKALPAEIVLRILEFATISSVASLTQLTCNWHGFIDHTHQDSIYASHRKTNYPFGAKDFSFLDKIESYDRYYEGISSWKDLCKRQTLLDRNWKSGKPKIKETLLVLEDEKPIWRFRADLKRRFVICTSEAGGLEVFDVDGKGQLWHHDYVPPYAHLEYYDGMAVVSTLGESLEVWTTDHEGEQRGVFRSIAVLDCPTTSLRGFHLTKGQLCVVGDDGCGLVYDMNARPISLRTKLDIPEGAVGHLCQGEDVVMYSMGYDGYHFYDKTTGERQGIFRPKDCERLFHISHARDDLDAVKPVSRQLVEPYVPFVSPSDHVPDRRSPFQVERGTLLYRRFENDIFNDEWGAGLLSGSLMVGISREGRVFICSNWPEVLRDRKLWDRYTSVIECQSNRANFNLGGWLSVRDNRILFEILDRVHLVQLNDDGSIPDEHEVEERPSWSWPSSSIGTQYDSVSLMALFDDCVMATSTVGMTESYHLTEGNVLIMVVQMISTQSAEWPNTESVKGLRVLSFAPRLA